MPKVKRPSKPTEIAGWRIDRLPSLLPARMLAMETKATVVKDDHMIAELDEDNDAFRALDFEEPADLPPKPITKPLTQGQRLLILQHRAEHGVQLWHPQDECYVPPINYLQVAALVMGVPDALDLPEMETDEEKETRLLCYSAPVAYMRGGE